MICNYRSKMYKKRVQKVEYDEKMIYKPKKTNSPMKKRDNSQ